MKQQMNEFDLFYISYDEPKCEENWADLLSKAPWAKRVHGVKGFDAAHQACAMQSETEHFITIDGDNIIDERMLDLTLDFPERYEKCVLSWNSTNAINGLVYGNGGVKLWTRDWVMNMKSHENADSEAKKLDFCWDNTYLQLNSILSTTYPNGSPFQAFRAGFREGVKMTLDRGERVEAAKVKSTVHELNLKRLMIWASVGADSENGLEAIYGTRLGIYYANIAKDFDLANISNYDWFKTFGEEKLLELGRHGQAHETIHNLGVEINRHLGLDISLLRPEQSKFFKRVYEHRDSQYSINIEKEIVVG